MPYADSEALKKYKQEYYKINREAILQDRKGRYSTRDNLLIENDKLKQQIKELNDKLLAAIEGRKYIKFESNIPDIVVNKGSYTVAFD